MALSENSALLDSFLSVGNVLGIVLKLGIVLLLVYGALHFLRKFNQSPPQNWNFKALFQHKEDIQLIQSLYAYHVTPVASLHLVRVAEHTLLLSIAGSEVKVLLELSDTDNIEMLKVQE